MREPSVPSLNDVVCLPFMAFVSLQGCRCLLRTSARRRLFCPTAERRSQRRPQPFQGNMQTADRRQPAGSRSAMPSLQRPQQAKATLEQQAKPTLQQTLQQRSRFSVRRGWRRGRLSRGSSLWTSGGRARTCRQVKFPSPFPACEKCHCTGMLRRGLSRAPRADVRRQGLHVLPGQRFVLQEQNYRTPVVCARSAIG